MRMGKGEFHKRVAAMKIELFAYISSVGFYSVVADEQLFGYLAAGFVVGDELQNAALRRRELLEVRPLF